MTECLVPPTLDLDIVPEIVHDCSWLFMSFSFVFRTIADPVHPCSWLFMIVHESSWVFTDVHVCSYLFMVVHACLWLLTCTYRRGTHARPIGSVTARLGYLTR
jgi:hypothetical protein